MEIYLLEVDYMNNNELLFLPPYLQQLGYENIKSIIELSNLVITQHADYIEINPLWEEWRDFFEYLSCIEFAYDAISDFPKGKAIGGMVIFNRRVC